MEAQHDRGLLPDELPALAQQIAQGALGLGIDVARRQNPQAQQVGEPPGVMLVIGVFEPRVLRQGRAVGGGGSLNMKSA